MVEGRAREKLEGSVPEMANEAELAGGAGEGLRLSRRCDHHPQGGYADSFDELMRATDWDWYGFESGNPKCSDCMVHSGYEASAVNDTFGS